MTILKSVAARVREATAKPVKLVHPTEPSLCVIYRAPTDRTEIARLKKKSEAQKEGGDFDAALLASTCVEIRQYDEAITDDDGALLTFRDKAVQEDFDAFSAKDAVRNFYGSDGYVSATALALMEAAGWGTDEIVADTDDPTS
jgi:hypothetical protein